MYLCGFGVGLSWGSILVTLDTDMIFPVEESDTHYVD